MTDKIYQTDAYCSASMARIMAKEFRDERFRIRLDRTIFCPAGGGQPADHGAINGVPLVELAVAGDDIIHVLERDPGQGEVSLQLDFQRRYDHMQQHTAQHLLSQVLLNLFNAPTLSFSIGPEHASIEIGRPGLSEAEIITLENECTRAIFANRPVRVFSSEDPSSLNLRKAPKRGGRIRVIEITGLDRSACGGTHVQSSAEIGLLKIIKTDRVRANLRLYYVCGFRALGDYQKKNEITQRLQRMITQPLAEIPIQVEALLKEKDDLRRELKKLRQHDWENEMARIAAAGEELVVREFPGNDAAAMRHFATALMKHGCHVLAYSALAPGHVIIGRGRGTFDLRQIIPDIFTLMNGKGGGAANLIEGRGDDFSKIHQIIALLQTCLIQ